MAGKFIESAVNDMKQRGTIGSFSSAAKRKGMPTMDFARQTMKSPSASSGMKKKANFAINASGSK